MSLYPPESNSPDTEFRADRERYRLAHMRLTDAGIDLGGYPIIDDQLAWRLWSRRGEIAALARRLQKGESTS